jgi:hypothetical protein
MIGRKMDPATYIRRRSLMRTIRREQTKFVAALLNVMVNHDILFRLVGAVNKKHHFLMSVFIAYPASREYAKSFFYERHVRRMKWTPRVASLIRQGRLWCVAFAISSTEEDFRDPKNHASLKRLVGQAERIRQSLGAPQKTFAGVLPGILFSRKLISEAVEAEVVVEVVLKAEAHVRAAVDYPPNTSLIVLGGSGFIGRRLVSRLADREVYPVDQLADARHAWPHHLAGKRSILINVASVSALAEYLALIWPGLVLLNEVYPEPSLAERTAFSTLGNPVFHVVGIKARAYPPAPKAYAGGIPCCAGWIARDMEAVIRRL